MSTIYVKGGRDEYTPWTISLKIPEGIDWK
jgi:hypothetical protein